jgi:hypothetical protein
VLNKSDGLISTAATQPWSMDTTGWLVREQRLNQQQLRVLCIECLLSREGIRRPYSPLSHIQYVSYHVISYAILHKMSRNVWPQGGTWESL